MAKNTPSHSSYYSHGLDRIYSYETINPSSVRQLKSPEETKNNRFSPSGEQTTDLSLDLFPTTTQRLREKEPVDSLRLSPFAMKAIKGLSVETIGELKQMISSKKDLLRSIGQSHIEEIENKIRSFFLCDENRFHPEVDVHSLIRFVLSKVPMKEKALIATLFHLKQFCFFPAAEEKEADLFLKKLSKEAQEEIFHKYIAKMEDPLQEAISLLSTSFTNPLLQKRGGLLSQQRFQLALFTASTLSSYSELQKLHIFFQKILPLKAKPWFALPFEYVDKCFICFSKEIALEAQEVIEQIHFFVKLSDKKISLLEMRAILWKFQAKRWNPLDESALEELLYWTYCPYTKEL